MDNKTIADPVYEILQEQLSRNPLYKIGINIISGKLTISEMIEKVTSIKYRFIVRKKHCLELNIYINYLRKINISDALTYSLVNVTYCLKRMSESDLIARISELHGDLLVSFNKQEEAVKYYSLAWEIYIELNQYGSAGKCAFEIAGAYEHLNETLLAVEALDSSIELFSEKKNYHMLGKCYLNKGRLTKKLGFIDVALIQYRLALMNYEKTDNNLSNLSLCYLQSAIILKEMGKIELSLEYLKLARKLVAFKRNWIEVSHCNVNLGNLYSDLGRYSLAMKLLKLARGQFAKEKLNDLVAVCNINIGLIYDKIREYDYCVEHYNAAEKVLLKIKNSKKELGKCLVNKARLYSRLKKHERALQLYGRARIIFEEELLTEDVKSCDYDIGILMIETSQYDKAISLFHKIIGMGNNNPKLLWKTFYYLGITYDKKGNNNDSIIYYDEAIKCIEMLTIIYPEDMKYFRPSIDAVYRKMINYCINIGDNELALEYFERLRLIKFASMVISWEVATIFSYRFALEENLTLSTTEDLDKFYHSMRNDETKNGNDEEHLSMVVKSVKEKTLGDKDIEKIISIDEILSGSHK